MCQVSLVVKYTTEYAEWQLVRYGVINVLEWADDKLKN